MATIYKNTTTSHTGYSLNINAVNTSDLASTYP